METAELPETQVERAKTFWAEEDVDQAFDGFFVYVDHLKRVLKAHTATDKEYVQALRLLECLAGSSSTSPADQDSSVVQVVIGSDELLPAQFSHNSPASDGTQSSAAPPAGQDELLPPLLPEQLQYQLHTCCKTCLPSLPSMPQSTPPFWGQNPLKVPLLCGFKRLSAVPLSSPGGGGASEDEGDQYDWDVIYKAPCGQSLRNYDDVMRFLLATESYDVLQMDFFTFSAAVRLDPPPMAGPRRPEQDLSRGAEPTPVELCVGDGGVRPAEFRYRKDRWPHGCFLSRGPALFHDCCDCRDGCNDASSCACIAMTTGGRHYNHHRLLEPVLSGLYECGPWCGCDRSRCQNRLVQRGVRVRLQVFQTPDRGWGVRCRDDLDRGTFVCVYAGVVLQRVPTPTEPPPPKLTRADLPSDDEVEVVTEWLAPPVLEGRSNLLETPPPPTSPPTSLPLHVPVIQRHADAAAVPQDRDKMVLVGGAEPTPPSAGDQNQKVSMTTLLQVRTTTNIQKDLKRTMDDVCLIDASREGNVGRFINHSCQPNLFVQNVFTDSHDPSFPVVAFFTSRAVVAGTELTWDYGSDSPASSPWQQEAVCLCGADGCRQRFTIQEKLCDVCNAQTEAQ
ncbi:histone-lysine N-methyltransferase SETDB2-like isoform X2 [Acanthochromis polyacanthus]|uniref:histone-lysine N-methyltransferase SETDB2-like isoform X2 n=1 Tax=Acanthochromis polyacanthus TaxID=80966 RepID=UPI00223458EF|nr:histone-lysine N-methyltransferase SETDB2-like isoform X2 [Acanthochromis polyacanthus]